MLTKEGIELIKEATDEYDNAYCLKNRLKPHKSSKEYDRIMDVITIRVQNIFSTCPDLWSYVDQDEDFFSPLYFRQNLVDLLNKYERTI